MQKSISIVTALYRSENYLEKFVTLCEEALQEINCTDYEIIMVNDGSPDNSLGKAITLKEKNEKIKVVELSRNFGHHYALMAGLETAEKDLVFTIDCDLEISPLSLIDFVKKYEEHSDIDVVYGVQEVRKGNFVERIGGEAFYFIFEKIGGIKIPKNILTERLMNRKYLSALIEMGDSSIFLAGMFHYIGFRQIPLAVKKGLREEKSTYTLGKRISLAFIAITSFSSYPLTLLLRMGMLITLLSFSIALGFVIYKVFNPEYVLIGFTSLIVAIFISLGIIIFSLGIIGLYIDKIFTQTKNRQRYIIRKIY